jgi:hypothetical protein
MAPSAPRTSFFSGTPTPVASLYAARSTAASSGRAADAADKLADSRWNRTRRDRELITWGRDDEEYKARKEAETSAGEFLANLHAELGAVPIGQYPEVRNKFVGSVPREVLEQPGTKASLAFYDKMYQDRELAERDDRRYQMSRDKVYDAERIKAAAAGVPVEDLDAAATPEELAAQRGAAERDQKLTEQLLQHGFIVERGNLRRAGADDAADRATRRKSLETAVADDGRFPATKGDGLTDKKMPAAERLAAEMNIALNSKEEDYVNGAGDISKKDKTIRRQVWREAQAMGADLGVGRVDGTGAASAEGKAPAAAPAALPRRTLRGVTYEKHPGGWKPVVK